MPDYALPLPTPGNANFLKVISIGLEGCGQIFEI